MPWVNLDDQMPEHPKVVTLSDGAFRLHVSGIAYCNRYKTDGYLPVAIVPRLTPTYRKQHLQELMQGPLGALWDPADGGYRVHDFLDWNRSRDEIETEQERLRKVRSEAGKKGAKARWG